MQLTVERFNDLIISTTVRMRHDIYSYKKFINIRAISICIRGKSVSFDKHVYLKIFFT